MRTFLIICLTALSAFSLNKYTIPFQASDSMTATQFNSNHDTAKAYLDKVIDTINSNVPRYTQNTVTHDKVMPYLRVDTIRSNPDIDSIKGNPVIDSISGNPVIDSISGNPVIDTVTTDSIGARTANFTGRLISAGSDSGSVACTLTAIGTGTVIDADEDSIGTLYYYKNGNFVTVAINGVDIIARAGTGACETEAVIKIKNYPSEIMPSVNISCPFGYRGTTDIKGFFYVLLFVSTEDGRVAGSYFALYNDDCASTQTKIRIRNPTFIYPKTGF